MGIKVIVKLQHDRMILCTYFQLLSIACPLEIMSCSNAFSTPLEIVPEWYLLLCFNLLRIVTSKGIGVKEMVILVPIIIFLCVIENFSVYSNPFRRAIMVCVTLV